MFLYKVAAIKMDFAFIIRLRRLRLRGKCRADQDPNICIRSQFELQNFR